jgi:hypothetical protein
VGRCGKRARPGASGSVQSEIEFRASILHLAIEGEQLTVFELRVHANDLGKVIGRQGRTAQAIRMILTGVGMKLRKCFTLEILE